ncbi:hypothetical protein QBC46DRAFT_317311 [Diplogelasinospora grovesii]|uniref:Histidine kinase group protein n=1 Tax=Diplogelasinospora grovesii TaxID=303347 RepID=A0AAN6S3J9_9PEZI|nr:hypothetical protein QBC46DRAFT_317311 [Diplogelasinospora grovesii]
MPRKKKSSSKETPEDANGSASPATPSLPSPTIPPTPSGANVVKTKALVPQPPPPALIICRNKHWRYISSFHGPWLQLPPEILETLAHTNYNTPRPRPIDPAVFFDLVKIRRLVDDATELAVRAASGVGSAQPNGASATHHAAALGLGFGFGAGGQAKLSRERKYRMREQAAQKLSRAYHLDEIASSVATMQSASPLEEVASLVLQRNAQDPDAKYVHFFHEKIPSRQLAECTSLTALNEIIADRPAEGEPLRTRAAVRIFKGDFEGAAADLTSALQVHRFHRPPHTAPKQPQAEQVQAYENVQHRTGRRQEDIVLKEDDQPSSLETQLLFQRAGAYLSIACRHVNAAFVGTPLATPSCETCAARGAADRGTEEAETHSHGEQDAQKVNEARKLVRHNAKRALRDYMAFLSHFEYSPNLPIEIAEDFTRRVNHAANGIRMPRSQYTYHPPPRSESPVDADGNPSQQHRIYALSDLFASAPPSDLPPYPSTEVVAPARQPTLSAITLDQITTTETITYHPLLSDALHGLLLCHSLIQTSAKELLRHAYMVARLARLADGYPVFQASRSPARADWMEVLRLGENWIQLAGSWESLCAPAPLPLFQQPQFGGSARQQQQQAVFDALGDDRVTDETTLRMAIQARQSRAERDYQLDNAQQHLRRWATDDGKEYPISTERATAVARWVVEAPANAGLRSGPTADGAARKRKKKPTTTKTASSPRVAAAAAAGGSGSVRSPGGSKTDLGQMTTGEGDITAVRCSLK